MLMNENKTRTLAALLSLCGLAAAAQGFNSGSDGSYGPLNVTSNTVLNVPTNGIFNCTTINVQAGTTLRFNPNPLNTPVYLLATGGVVIAGVVNVDGQTASGQNGGAGGPGGFAGGTGGLNTIPPGAGYGPGAGLAGQDNSGGTMGAGRASYGVAANSASTNNGAPYGSPLLMPLVGGSGGGGSPGNPGQGGGGGGGAVLIASNTKITFNSGNSITAIGGGGGAGGSGGAIRLVSQRIEGAPQMNASVQDGNAGLGRIRVDVIERDALNLSIDTRYMSAGSFLQVFPAPNARLDIIQAAGTNIAEGNSGPVVIELPFGSATNRTVTVQARDFAAVVPIRLTLTPEAGVPQVYDATIDNVAANPATNIFNVTVPVNTRVGVNAWTR